MRYENGSQTHSYYSRATSENNALDEAVWMQQRITGFSYCASGLLRGKRPRFENGKHKNVVFKSQFPNFQLFKQPPLRWIESRVPKLEAA
jgi:hypothetical protein